MRDEALQLLLLTIGDGAGKLARPEATEPSPSTLRQAFALAEANGLLYAMASCWTGSGNSLPRETLSRWEKEQEQRNAFRRTVEVLNRTEAASGHGYCMIKDYQVVENVPRDVDIFVNEEDQPSFLRALLAEGFEFSYRDEAEVSLSKPGHLRVDVYGRIHYLGRDFLDSSFIESARRPTRTHGMDHPGLSPEARLVLNSAHAIYGHAALTLLDFLDFRALRALVPDLAEATGVAEARGWGRVFVRWQTYLRELEAHVLADGKPLKFPIRHGMRFVLACTDELDGRPLSPRDRRMLILSLLWDDLIFASESAGWLEALKGSGIATLAGNTAGHQLRIKRGDRKGSSQVMGAGRDP